MPDRPKPFARAQRHDLPDVYIVRAAESMPRPVKASAGPGPLVPPLSPRRRAMVAAFAAHKTAAESPEDTNA